MTGYELLLEDIQKMKTLGMSDIDIETTITNNPTKYQEEEANAEAIEYTQELEQMPDTETANYFQGIPAKAQVTAGSLLKSYDQMNIDSKYQMDQDRADHEIQAQDRRERLRQAQNEKRGIATQQPKVINPKEFEASRQKCTRLDKLSRTPFPCFE